jgi:hypothetical protein
VAPVFRIIPRILSNGNPGAVFEKKLIMKRLP